MPWGVEYWRFGQPFEVHDVPIGIASTVSFAIRWHGPRPAVLWEVHGAPVELRSPQAAPAWSTREPRGEALWPAPSVVPVAEVVPVPGSPSAAPDGASFS